MSLLLKCAACGASVPFESDSPSAEATCPDCEVHLRRRPGDEQMAIPVGMVLPEKFSQVDLKSLSKQSEVLIERYRKTPPPSSANTASSVDATLAKALESLANTIGHLDERLARQERRSEGGTPEDEPHALPVADDEPQLTPVAEQPPVDSGVPEEVVQLETGGKGKALPLKAPVLVRREAAQEAHNFQRRKQSLVDHRGREQVEEGFFQTIMEKAPKTTMAVSLLFVVGLTAGMIWWMDPTYRGGDGQARVIEPTKKTALGKLWDDDPEAGHAEAIAKAYLNATTAGAALPFVYESESLGEKFERLYRPISTPGEYEIELKSRVRAPDGKGSIFAYRVTTADEQSRMLVVLPEGSMPKVYWQFFQEVGDMSWEQFMEERPAEPTGMRVWLEPSNEYFAPYNADRWRSFIIHDYEDSFTLRAFVERGTGLEWKLNNALEKEPRKFGRRTAIMAHLDLTFMSELERAQDERIFVVEIKEVHATDWLPERFRHSEGARVEASEPEADE